MKTERALGELVGILKRSGCPYKEVVVQGNRIVVKMPIPHWYGFPKQIDNCLISVEVE